MTKFLQIRSRILLGEDHEKFEKKTESTALKSLFKCKAVCALGPTYSSNYNGVTDIPERLLNDLALALKKDIILHGPEVSSAYAVSKEYIFSDDAQITPISALVLADGIQFTAFELNSKEVAKLLEIIYDLEATNLKINQIMVAEENISSLQELEHELGLNVLNYDADSDVSQLRKDTEKELIRARKKIRKVLNSGWKII